MSFSWGRTNAAVSGAAAASVVEEIRELSPARNSPGVLPYPLDAVLEPQLPPDGFLLLEELLQRLGERRRRGDLRGHDSGGLEPAHRATCSVPPQSRNAPWPGARRGVSAPRGVSSPTGSACPCPHQAAGKGQCPAGAKTTARGEAMGQEVSSTETSSACRAAA